MTSPLVLPLYGDNTHNDSAVIAHLLNGGAAYDVRSDRHISAPTLAILPPGLYLMTNKLPMPPTGQQGH